MIGLRNFVSFFGILLIFSTCGIVRAQEQEQQQHVVNILTILNGQTFQADREVFARALKANNGNSSRGVRIHSVELQLTAKGGLAEYLQDLCAAADASTTAWMAIINLADQAAVFASAMVGQQLAVPTLAYVNTLEPELYKVGYQGTKNNNY